MNTKTTIINTSIDRKGSMLDAVVALRPTSCATASWSVSASTLATLPLEAFPLLLAAETQDEASDVVQACGVQS